MLTLISHDQTGYSEILGLTFVNPYKYYRNYHISKQQFEAVLLKYSNKTVAMPVKH